MSVIPRRREADRKGDSRFFRKLIKIADRQKIGNSSARRRTRPYEKGGKEGQPLQRLTIQAINFPRRETFRQSSRKRPSAAGDVYGKIDRYSEALARWSKSIHERVWSSVAATIDILP